MNWTKLALGIPTIINFAMNAVEKIKGAKGQEKEKAVLDTITDGIMVGEILLDKDLVNDTAIQSLMSNYIAARVSLLNAISAAKALKPQV